MKLKPGLAIKINLHGGNTACALCGADFEPEIGPQITLAENNDPVCQPCAEKEAPFLTDLLALSRQATYHSEMMESFQQLWFMTAFGQLPYNWRRDCLAGYGDNQSYEPESLARMAS